jgi:hypothetical protein
MHDSLGEIDLHRFNPRYSFEALLDALGAERTHHPVHSDPVEGGARQGYTVAETDQPQGDQWE